MTDKQIAPSAYAPREYAFLHDKANSIIKNKGFKLKLQMIYT